MLYFVYIYEVHIFSLITHKFFQEAYICIIKKNYAALAQCTDSLMLPFNSYEVNYFTGAQLLEGSPRCREVALFTVRSFGEIEANFFSAQ